MYEMLYSIPITKYNNHVQLIGIATYILYVIILYPFSIIPLIGSWPPSAVKTGNFEEFQKEKGECINYDLNP